MCGITTFLSSDLASKRIFLFEGQLELIYLAYVKEIQEIFRKSGQLLVERVYGKDCSHALLLEKLHSPSCFGRIFFTYDDPRLPLSKIGKIENYLCLYSRDGFKICPQRDDLVKISFSDATLGELITYYSSKYRLNFSEEAVRVFVQHLKRSVFAIDAEMLKFKHYFGSRNITVDDVLTLCEPTSPSVNKFCRSIFALEVHDFYDSIARFSETEGMLIIRSLMKYCDAVLDVVASTVRGIPKNEIIQNLRKKQFYDLEIIDQAVKNFSYRDRANVMLLALPKLETQYKLFSERRFTFLVAGLSILFAQMK
ncbi:hypothetical protein GP480_02600 [Neorickettsia findlayensis]|uniref:Uncharacterized protein n=1 Tax=Neorickettsia findlayensis TaxID=2686014 RepID=A0A6P1GAX7_9RICK|nr:hypothetical protein GP480_02600 [Neorickettsia findlayensis]